MVSLAIREKKPSLVIFDLNSSRLDRCSGSRK
jgi:hypothetical protein